MNSLHEYSLTCMFLLIKIFRLGNLLGQEDPLEKEMANHSSILPWRIPWIGEPGGCNLVGYSPWGHKVLDMTK